MKFSMTEVACMFSTRDQMFIKSHNSPLNIAGVKFSGLTSYERFLGMASEAYLSELVKQEQTFRALPGGVWSHHVQVNWVGKTFATLDDNDCEHGVDDIYVVVDTVDQAAMFAIFQGLAQFLEVSEVEVSVRPRGEEGTCWTMRHEQFSYIYESAARSQNNTSRERGGGEVSGDDREPLMIRRCICKEDR